MFTGLIQEVGRVQSSRPKAQGLELSISSPHLAPDIKEGDSVAVNGVCQTATHIGPQHFVAMATGATLQKTALKSLKAQEEVNLELALRPMDRLGGHLVQGHVGGVATIKRIEKRGSSWIVTLSNSPEFSPYMVKEGPVCLDGVGLTLSDCGPSFFRVSLIPHTRQNTTTKNWRVGDKVNVEVDLLAKYVESFVCTKSSAI